MKQKLLTNLDFNSKQWQINLPIVLDIITTQAALTALLASASGLGFYAIGFDSPTGITGLAKGDIIRHSGAGSNSIYVTFAQAPNTIYRSSVGAYSKSIDNWKLLGAAKTFSNANYTIPIGVTIVSQIGSLSALRTVTLPSAASVMQGDIITVYDQSGTPTITNAIRIIPAGSDTINGNNSSTLPIFITQPYGSVDFISDGVSKWTAIQNKLLSTAIAQFSGATISGLGNLNFSAVTISNNGASGGNGNITWSSGTASKITFGAGRWRVTLNMGARSGSNGYVNTAFVNSSNSDLGSVWANGFVMNTGRATDWSSNFGGWNEFNVAAGSTQDAYFRIWGIGGAINIGSDSFLTIQQLS